MGTFLSSPQGDILTESRHVRGTHLTLCAEPPTIPHNHG